MRSSPTSRGVAVFVLAVGLALFGCATGNGDAEDPDEGLAMDDDPRADDNKKKSETDDAPDFDADFDSDAGEDEEDDPDEDTTPPGGDDQCIDKDDPGGTPNAAKALPDTDDCDNDYKTVSGVMNGAVDVDVFSLSASDEGVSTSHPVGCKLDTDFEGQTAGTEVCVYARCKNTTIDAVTGCDQGVTDQNDIGMKGCCAAAPGKAVPKWDCSGFTDDDSADFFIRVKQINADKCLPYKFRYRY